MISNVARFFAVAVLMVGVVASNPAPSLALEITPAFTPLAAPCLAYDSALATGTGITGALAADEIPSIRVIGSLGSQGGATVCVQSNQFPTAVVLAVTAVDPQAAGNLIVSAMGVVPQGGVVNCTTNGLNNSNTVTVEPSSFKIDIAAKRY